MGRSDNTQVSIQNFVPEFYSGNPWGYEVLQKYLMDDNKTDYTHYF